MTTIKPPLPSALPQIFVPTTDQQNFPVGRIFCVGQNYAAHAIEMGGNPDRNPPFFFSKWPSALLNAAKEDHAHIPYPKNTQNLHPEVELAVAINKGSPLGSEITVENALSHVFGFATSLDMTKRDIQAQAKEKGRPWEAAKNFDYSCPIGRIVPLDKNLNGNIIKQAKISLKVNGEMRQSSTIGHMIWAVEEIIANLSQHIALRAGDLILTGTPEGVAAVERGDVLNAQIEGLPELEVQID